MQSSDFVTANHIIANVAKTVGDEKFRKGFSKSWYISTIQDGLQELAFDTFFQEIPLDYDLPDNLVLDFPKNAFNLRNIYIYNGNGCCNPVSSQLVHWKREFNNKGKGDGYTARVKEGFDGITNQSPFVANYYDWNHGGYEPGIKYYFNVQDGKIMFSSSCRGFKKVRIIVNGMGAEIGEIPVIPRFFEEAIKDWCKEKFYEGMMARDPRMYRILYETARNQRLDRVNGSWKEARLRVTRMDSAIKEDLNEYISAAYHK